jgi:putative endopeptidase
MPQSGERTEESSFFEQSKALPTVPHIPKPREGIRPGTDFYSHVNANWLRHVSMPPYQSSFGVSEEIEQLVDKDLQTILHSARSIVRTKADKGIPHTTYLLGTLTESCLNSQVQDLNVKFVQNLVSGLRCIRDTNDIASTLGDFLKHRVGCMLQSMVVPTERKSSIVRFALLPGELGLPDPAYYKPSVEGTSRVLLAYSSLLKRLGDVFDVPGLEQLVTLETQLAPLVVESRGDGEELLKGSDLLHTYRHIPWERLFESALGWTPSEFRSHTLLIVSPSWIRGLNKWFSTLPLDQWKIWLSGCLILHCLPLLPPPFDQMHFELFGRRLRGEREKLPQGLLALRLAKSWLSGSLGAAFVKQFVEKETKQNAKTIAEEIRNVAAYRVAHTDWLDPETRRIAEKKVQAMYLGVAYPSHIDIDKKTTLDAERLIQNVFTLAELDFQDESEKINTRLKPEQWDDAVFAVNAFYYTEGNRLILPAGILRWPFFHPKASDGWNFGGLGATIGHEITHAFDVEGKDYDEHGNLDPWWSSADMKRYKEKTQALIELYTKTQYFGRNLNGLLTLSENISDLGGLAIALAALKARLKKKSLSQDAYHREICAFFTSYAVSWRTKEKKEKALQSLVMDVHAPPIARVNNIVSQFDDWYDCYGIVPGDPLYKAPERRIRIF